MKRTSAALLLIALTGCGGGGSPSRPSNATPAPTSTTFAVVSGESDAPVGGATIVLAGATLTSDASGHVAVQPPPAAGSLVDIIAPGFLDRQTLVRRGMAIYTLWPRTSPPGLTEDFTSRIVYTDSGDDNADVGGSGLERLRNGTSQAFVVASASIQSDGPAMAMHDAAVGEINSMLAGALSYALVTQAASGSVAFEARLDPADPDCAPDIRGFASLSLRGGEIVSGRIVYCSKDAARASTVTHELGHTLGLQHSPNDHELMAPFFARQRSTRFSAREGLAVALMLQRRGGNRFPDNDRDATTSARSGTVVIRCQ